LGILTKKCPAPWRQIQRKNFTCLDTLATFLELTIEQRAKLLKHPHFSLNFPVRLAQKVTKKTLNDPILKQFIPHVDETIPSDSFCPDPVNDRAFRVIYTELLSKYEVVSQLLHAILRNDCRDCVRKNFSL
jgi:L-lysine 2,3-aminomutase